MDLAVREFDVEVVKLRSRAEAELIIEPPDEETEASETESGFLIGVWRDEARALHMASVAGFEVSFNAKLLVVFV